MTPARSEARYRDAWDEYKAALAQLHGARALERTAFAEAAPVDRAGAEVAGARIEAASAATEEALVPLLRSSEPAARAQAASRLVCLAAVDLQAAVALTERDEDAPQRIAPVLGDAFDELLPILDAPAAPAVAAGRAEAAAAAPPSPADRERLRTALDAALVAVRDGAGARAQGAFASLLASSAASALGRVVETPLAGVAARLPGDVGRLRRFAAALVARALRKLLALVPDRLEEEIRKRATAWVSGGGLEHAVLEKLWDLDARRTALHALVATAPDGDGMQRASAGVAQLESAFAAQMKGIGWIVKGLDAVGGAVSALVPPWGAMAVCGGYVLAGGYAVLSGGDLVDGDRSLDLVPGIPTIVREAFAA